MQELRYALYICSDFWDQYSQSLSSGDAHQQHFQCLKVVVIQKLLFHKYYYYYFGLFVLYCMHQPFKLKLTYSGLQELETETSLVIFDKSSSALQTNVNSR